VRQFSSTLPVAGVIIAICVGAASVALVEERDFRLFLSRK
jgi:hypothetical protein